MKYLTASIILSFGSSESPILQGGGAHYIQRGRGTLYTEGEGHIIYRGGGAHYIQHTYRGRGTPYSIHTEGEGHIIYRGGGAHYTVYI